MITRSKIKNKKLNQSLTSFLIPIQALTQRQIGMIKCSEKDDWFIILNDQCLFGYTFYSKFNMKLFLNNIVNLDKNYIYWDKTNINLDLHKINIEILLNKRKNKLDNIYKNVSNNEIF